MDLHVDRKNPGAICMFVPLEERPTVRVSTTTGQHFQVLGCDLRSARLAISVAREWCQRNWEEVQAKLAEARTLAPR